MRDFSQATRASPQGYQYYPEVDILGSGAIVTSPATVPRPTMDEAGDVVHQTTGTPERH
jgi:hypothetical protein